MRCCALSATVSQNLTLINYHRSVSHLEGCGQSSVVGDFKIFIMDKLKNIEQGTDKCVFDWILQSERNGTTEWHTASLIRALIKRHNDMVTKINDLEEKILKSEATRP
jgi:hypothetical protein